MPDRGRHSIRQDKLVVKRIPTDLVLDVVEGGGVEPSSCTRPSGARLAAAGLLPLLFLLLVLL